MTAIDPELFKHKDAVDQLKLFCDLKETLPETGGNRGQHEGRRGTSSFNYRVGGGFSGQEHSWFTGGMNANGLIGTYHYLEHAFGAAKKAQFCDEKTGQEIPLDDYVAGVHYIQMASIQFGAEGQPKFSLVWNTQKTGTAIHFNSSEDMKQFEERVQKDALALGVHSRIERQ